MTEWNGGSERFLLTPTFLQRMAFDPLGEGVKMEEE